MIKIENNVPVPDKGGRPWKYKEYVDAFVSMKEGESFVVNDYKIVDSVRKYAWKNKIPCSFRTLAREKYRVWKMNYHSCVLQEQIKIEKKINES